MDHRVSKDMISSGMTPSGDKSQADLGKTQYGSAPSPSRLMDAYHSMYQNQKEETLDEMAPRPMKRRKVTKSLDQVKADNEARKQKERARSAKAREEDKDVEAFIGSLMDRGEKLRDAKTSPEAQKFERDKFREGQRRFRGNYGENVDLLAAYYAVYEHHQKDENGNTIPHEDDVKEGKIPAGLQAYLDKKKGKKKDDEGGEKESKKKDKKDMKEGAGLYANIHAKRKRGGKMRKKGAKGAPSAQDFANAARTAKEDVDMFDTILNHYVNEGYDAEDVIETMSSLNEEELQNLYEEPITATLLAIGGKLAKAGAMASKFGAKAGKALGKVKNIAKSTPVRQSVKGPGYSTGSLRKGNLKFSGDAKYKQMKKGIDPKPSKPNMLTKAKDTFDKMSPLEKVYTVQAGSSLIPSGGGGGGSTKKVGTVSASADLFDIVKGQLLDEGLTEQEVVDIMTTLTLDEINETLQLDEITGKLAMQASKAADMKRAQLAKAGDKAGAAAKAAQASRLYKKGAEKNLAKQDLSKPLNPQRTDYPMGKGASYQQKPGMSESLTDAYLKVYEESGEGFGEKPEGSEEKPIEKKVKPKKERMTQQERNFARKTFGKFINRKFGK